MDTCAVDITELSASPDSPAISEGDEVIVFGDAYPLAELASDLDTIPYEILTNISRRVKRVYFFE